MRIVAATAMMVMATLAGCGDDRTPAAGDDAPPSRVTRIDVEPAGGNCPQGGAAIRSGADHNGNGILDDDEIEATQYVCGVVTSDVYDGSVSEETWSDPAKMALVDRAKVITGDVWFIGAHTHALPQLEQILGGLSLNVLPVAEPVPSVQRIVGGIGGGQLGGRLSLPRLHHLDRGLAIYSSPGLEVSLPELVGTGTIHVERGALARLDISKLIRVDGDAALCEVAALDAPMLAVITGNASLCTSAAVTYDQLTTIGGDLSVAGDLALPALRDIGGSLRSWLAATDPGPTAIALPRLEHVHGELKLGGGKLERIELPALGKVNRGVMVSGPALATLTIPKLAFVGVDDDGQWAAATDRQLTIWDTALTSIDLPLLGGSTSWGSEAYLLVHISSNPKLESLSLATMTDAESFEVEANPKLKLMHAPVLARVQWTFAVKQNAALEQMDVALMRANRVAIGPMPAASVANLRGLLEADSISINNTGVTDLTGLASLRRVNQLTIRDNAQLASLHGLESVAIAQWLWLDGNLALTSLDGLTVTRDFAPSVIIQNHPALTSLGALAGIERMAGVLSIDNNEALHDLGGLESLRAAAGVEIVDQPRFTSLAPLAHLEQVGSLFLYHLDGLTTLTELTDLRTISQRLVVDKCNGLTSLAGVSAAVALDSFEISYNDHLTSLAGLEHLTSIGGDLNLVGNGALTGLGGLASLTHVGGDVHIDQNPLLTADQIAAFMHQLGH
jgi:hypothetical protein